MSTPAKLNFKIYQGSTFAETLRWESSIKAYIPITGITKSAPLVVTAPAHGIPLEWRVKFTNIIGMTDINSDSTYYQVSAVTTNTLTINSINSLGFKAYISDGIVEYNQPVDMTGYTAKMQIREKITDTAFILELTTENSGIVINNVTKSITLNISAAATAALTFTTGVYDLEVISSGAQVTTFIGGNLTLVKGVTR